MKKAFFFLLTVLPFYILNAQVGIGTTNPDPSSILDVTSSDKGVLVPRVSLSDITVTTLDGTNTIAEGLLIYNTNAAVTGGNGVGYYFYNGTSWLKLSTTSVTDDADFFEEGTTNSPSNINDDIYTQGNLAIGKITADYPLDIQSEGVRGVSVDVNSTSTAPNTGVYIRNRSNNTSNLKGTSIVLNATTPNQIGIETSLSGNTNTNASVTGISQGISTASKATGIFQNISSSATSGGSIYGQDTRLTASSGNLTGSRINITGNGNVGVIGSQMALGGNTTQNQIANFVRFNQNTGSGTLYGYFLQNNGSGSGSHYGANYAMNSTGNGNQYGVQANIGGTGTGNKYGLNVFANPSTGGTQYGVYSNVQKTGSYAGYFIGDVRLQSLGGSGSQMVVVDNDGDVSTQALPGDDADFYEEGTTEAPDDIRDDIYTLGNVAIGKNTADYPLDVQTNRRRGLQLDMTSNISGTQYGIYTSFNSPVSNTRDRIGIFNNFTGIGSNPRIGFSTNIQNNWGTFSTGMKTTLNNRGNNRQTGEDTTIGGTTAGRQIGNAILISNSGNGTHYGDQILMSGNGSGTHYGYYTELTAGSGTHYGSYNLLTSNGVGDKYGYWTSINATARGTHYGVYSDVQKSGSFAGYFIGDVRMTSLGGSGNQMVVVDNDGDLNTQALPETLPAGGNSGDVLSTDGSGNYTWVVDNVNDADADPTNEIELPSGGNSGDILSTDGSGNYTWVTDANDSDADFYEIGTTNAPDAITDNVFTQGRIAIGASSLTQDSQVEINTENTNSALYLGVNTDDRSALTLRRSNNAYEQGVAFQNNGGYHSATLFHTSQSATGGLNEGLAIATIGNQIDPSNLGTTATFKNDGTLRLHTYGSGSNVDTAPTYLLGVQSDGDVVAYDNSVAAVGAPTFGTNWEDYSVAFGTDYEDARYYIRDNRVHLAGLIRKTAAVGNADTMITLPVGYRPLKRRIFNMQSAYGAVRIDVLNNGQVRILAGNQDTGQNWVSLEGISFRID